MQCLGICRISASATRPERSASASTRCAAGIATASSRRPATSATAAASRRARSSGCARVPTATAPATQLSTRNRFPGVVTSVEVDGVMALVEIEAGPHRVTAAITRDSVEELGLARGRRGDRARQGDLGDGRARRRRRVMRSALVVGASLAAALAGCGEDSGRARRLRGRRSAGRVGRLLARARVRAPTPNSSPDPTPSSRSPAPTTSPRRSARASRPDVYAAANTTLPGRPLQGRPGREAGRLRHQHARARRARRLRRSTRSTTSTGRRRRSRSATRASRSATTRARSSTRLPAAECERDPAPTCARSEPDVAGIVGKLTQGAVDAGFVYITDVRRNRRRARGDRRCPPTSSPTSPTARRSSTARRTPSGAQAFVDGLLDGDGRRGPRRRRLRPAAGALSDGPTRPVHRRCWSARSRSRSPS